MEKEGFDNGRDYKSKMHITSHEFFSEKHTHGKIRFMCLRMARYAPGKMWFIYDMYNSVKKKQELWLQYQKVVLRFNISIYSFVSCMISYCVKLNEFLIDNTAWVYIQAQIVNIWHNISCDA